MAKTLANKVALPANTQTKVALAANTQVIDSYSDTNKSENISLYSGSKTGVGHSFTNTNAGVLDKCVLLLSKTGSPTGNAVAKVYAHSGTYGTSSVPTGSALATSNNQNVAGLTTSDQLIPLYFSGAQMIDLSATTKYIVTVEYSGGDASNKLNVGQDATAPTHGGNQCSYEGAWAADSTKDLCFFIYNTKKVALTT